MKFVSDVILVGFEVNAAFPFKASFQLSRDGVPMVEAFMEGPTAGNFGEPRKPNVCLFHHPIKADGGQDVEIKLAYLESSHLEQGASFPIQLLAASADGANLLKHHFKLPVATASQTESKSPARANDE